MQLRTILSTLVAAAIAFTSACAASVPKTAMEFDPRAFGVIPSDGLDDYPGLLKLRAAVVAAGGGTVVFPPGTYDIKVYATAGNGLTSVFWENLDGAHFKGYGATFNVKGDFYRDVTSTMGVMPFYFRNCNNLRFEGFTLDGNVDQMTKAGGVTEPAQHGLGLFSCTNVVVENVYAHHWAADGLYIGAVPTSPPRIASKNVVVRNYRSYANGRQGVSIAALQRGLFDGCSFERTGYTSADGLSVGAYGGHAPQYGVDIEPNWVADGSSVDAWTEQLTFRRCRIVANRAVQFASTGGMTKTRSVYVRDCEIDHLESTALYAMILDSTSNEVTGCTIDTRASAIYPSFSNIRSRVLLKDNTIYTTGKGILATSYDLPTLVIEGNRIINQNTTYPGGSYRAPDIDNNHTTLRGNYFFYPKEMHRFTSDGSAFHIVSNINSCDEISGNTWDTDLTNQGHYFYLGLGGSTNIFNEDYSGRKAFEQARAHSTTRAYLSGEYTKVGIRYYRCDSPGPGNATVAPTHLGGTATGADGYTWTYRTIGAAFRPSTGGSAVAMKAAYTNREVSGGTRLVLREPNNFTASIGAVEADPLMEWTDGDFYPAGSVILNLGATATSVPFKQVTTAGWGANTAWVSGSTPALGSFLYNASKVYRVVTVGGGTSTVAPTHTTSIITSATPVDADGFAFEYVGALAVATPALPLGTALPITNGGTGVTTGLSVLPAANLTGTLPAAVFPTALPTTSGANLTALNAANLGSGTVPDARFPATLPAIAGTNLTGVAKTGSANALTGDQTVNSGDLVAATAGRGIRVKEGSNARMGQATLVGGTVTVSNTSVTANTRIWLSRATAAGTRGFLTAASIVAATSFTIRAEDAAGALTADTSTVNWLLIDPAP